jgi:hypothetical protein
MLGLLLSLDVKLLITFQPFNEHFNTLCHFCYLSNRFTTIHQDIVRRGDLHFFPLNINTWHLQPTHSVINTKPFIQPELGLTQNSLSQPYKLFLQPQQIPHGEYSLSQLIRPIKVRYHKHIQLFMQSVCYFCLILTKTGMYWQILVEISNMKYLVMVCVDRQKWQS